VVVVAYGEGGGTVATFNFNTIGSGAGGSPGAAKLIGFVSDAAATDIARISITETDANASFPDCNIGFDTIR
jgi:hypothetical protein